MNDRTDSRDNNPECKNPEWVKRYHAPQNRAAREADYLHRLRAAGIDPEAELPEDMDAFRYRLARMILMYVNDWPGCPLPICRRMRGCMAPENVCANNADDPPATHEEWDKVRFEVRRALDERMAELGLED